ncbi:hypothetical protein CS176_0123 [Corynebacterium glutamicum]|uniref:hypothetical protein n=1 Tax=Corynebacterium glutamicum TaxID=1718 RepID=UPI00097A716E|nr:hypothetical protein [Corynebacterium glutamicum]GAV95893.1 hypothetical protein CS176_0123 [Corynebacterium glutamicum]
MAEQVQCWWGERIVGVAEQNRQRVLCGVKAQNIPFQGGAHIDVRERVFHASETLQFKNAHRGGQLNRSLGGMQHRIMGPRTHGSEDELLEATALFRIGFGSEHVVDCCVGCLAHRDSPFS